VVFQESTDSQSIFALHLDREKMIVELGHLSVDNGMLSATLSWRRAMVCESIGPVRHEVSVPFHDSQVRQIALLIQTGWDGKWGTSAYDEPGPYLAEHLIFRMVRSGIQIVGVDFPIIAGSRETRLITAGKIPIVENLKDLKTLPRVGFKFAVQPLGVERDGVCGVRAVAQLAD
jgi:kynurenine formamidase